MKLAGKGRQLVFMFAGQGSQYYLMGKELYETNNTFKKYMDACSAVYQSEYGTSLTETIYDEANKRKEFDNIIETHPAVFSIGFSLAQTLIEEGTTPTAVLGHSLGEYIAAVVAGVMSYDDALKLLIKQSQLLKERCSGGLMSILASAEIFERRNDLFEGITLAGVNYSGNFFISGPRSKLEKVSSLLDKEEDVLAVKLPVNYAFHSEEISSIETAFNELVANIDIRLPKIEIYSSALGGKLNNSIFENTAGYLWSIVRDKVRFDELMSKSFSANDGYYFVDLSASGTLSTFLKYSKGTDFPRTFAINQFGDNKRTMDKLRMDLRG
jgi:acyl transferase domain-containing protein